MNEHSLWIHISQLPHRTALWPFRIAPLQRPQSALQLHVVQYQAPSPDSILTSSLSPRFEHEAWKRFSHFLHSRSLSDALQYFLHTPHWNLGPELISISPARIIWINKFVPFEGLKLRSPSELILAKYWQWNFRLILIVWVPGQGSGVWDFNPSNAIWCSWQGNGSRNSMPHIP